jgi:hypothetical protein
MLLMQASDALMMFPPPTFIGTTYVSWFCVSCAPCSEIAIGAPFIKCFRSRRRDQREDGRQQSHEVPNMPHAMARVSSHTMDPILDFWPTHVRSKCFVTSFLIKYWHIKSPRSFWVREWSLKVKKCKRDFYALHDYYYYNNWKKNHKEINKIILKHGYNTLYDANMM